MKSRSYNAFAIIHKNIMYSLKKPLRLTVINTGTYYYIEYPDLGIVGMGRNTHEAKKSFANDFDYLYTTVTTNSNSQLTKSKTKIKTKLLEIVDAKKEI